MAPTTSHNEAKELANTLRKRTLSYKDVGNVVNGTVEIVKPLKRLIGENSVEAKAKDSRLITAGIALIAFPDPTITDVVGAGLVAAGLIKSRMRQTTAADVCEELRKVTRKIENLKKEIIIK